MILQKTAAIVDLVFREAELSDIEQMRIVRASVRENRLSSPGRITVKDYEGYLLRCGKGWVCLRGDCVVGFAIVDLLAHNVWALFVLPEFEGSGIGKTLQRNMLDWYFSNTDSSIWLSTSAGTRAEKFYRETGWKECGLHGNGELKFEMSITKWKTIR